MQGRVAQAGGAGEGVQGKVVQAGGAERWCCTLLSAEVHFSRDAPVSCCQHAEHAGSTLQGTSAPPLWLSQNPPTEAPYRSTLIQTLPCTYTRMAMAEPLVLGNPNQHTSS